MIQSMLNSLAVPNKETRFIQPPKSTYAVWFDNQSVYGCDNFNVITIHDATVELYEYVIDIEIENAIEDYLNSIPLEYVKHERTWLNTESLYQIIYEFEYITKECINNE
ncbi:MAG: hypothetical protein LIO71_04490 [Ruminococcus sp.]|nr:hypothetical protein [Ruminococcus sp.]MCD7800676.1 hypothetical protein [Ruminococcus sp.]